MDVPAIGGGTLGDGPADGIPGENVLVFLSPVTRSSIIYYLAYYVYT